MEVAMPYYIVLVDFSAGVAEHYFFQNFVTLVIIIASMQVGMETDAAMSIVLVEKLWFLDAVTRNCNPNLSQLNPDFNPQGHPRRVHFRVRRSYPHK